MSGNKLSYFIVAITLAIFVPQAQADTNQEQTPAGDTIFLNVDKTKITFRITSNDSYFRNLVLNVVVGTFRVHQERPRGNYTVIYNSCTDSDQPTSWCKEAQITLWRREHKFQNISFGLYNGIVEEEILSTVQLQPPTTTDPTDQTLTRLTTTLSIIDTGSNKGALDSASMGLIIAVAVCLLIIVALILAMVVMYMKRTKNGSTQDVENQTQPN